MNKLRIVGLVLLAALIALFAARNFIASSPEQPPPPPRAVFDGSQPLRIETQGEQAPWMTRELRNLLARSKLNLVSIATHPTGAQSFTLRIDVQPAKSLAGLALVAPDGVVERSELLQLPQDSQLAAMRRLAERLPSFLGAANGSDWSKLLGTEDASAYATFLNAGDAWFAEDATGFTAPSSPTHDRVSTLERLERVTRRFRDFARARALLALGYLSVGGEDADSLTRLAETSAQRALTADPELADAHAALGIVYARKMDWATAQEHLQAALALDANNVAALEALGCLLLDVGRVDAALAHAHRAATLQPGNRGAHQCAAYARIAMRTEGTGEELTADTARIQAAVLLLENDRFRADALLREHKAVSDELIRAVIDASTDRSKVPDALKIITRSADDETIDAHTEVLFGAALRRPDFVFNRMLRQVKAGEAVPLRLLWLPQTDFLRKHRRFREIVNATKLAAYWQKHGLPDVCSKEPTVYGCTLKRR
jgi:tetratricopeptide (TPR) repeat protein